MESVLTQENETMFFDQQEAADFLKLSPRTLEKLRVAGDGPPYLKYTRRVVYDRVDLIDWARSSRRGSTSEVIT